jgi:alanine racemase
VSVAVTTRALATRTIDHAAIAHNVRTIARESGRPVMAVVKANGFGHGAIEVAHTALASGATWLGVATIDEALALRGAGFTCPIFAWIVDPWCDLDSAVREQIALSCANVETLAAVAEAAARVGERASIHLELDTGMARGGSSPELWPRLCAAARVATGVSVDGVWSHLALAALTGESHVHAAVARLESGIHVARLAGLNPRHLHLANSAGALAHPSTRLTMVRAGAGIYGIETVHDANFGLVPAMRVNSRVTQLREVGPGTGVGYLHEFRAEHVATLALVPVGYGDGLPKAGGFVSIDGNRFPIRGAVSMDQIIVEVDHQVALGDEVVLLGDARRGEPSALDWARLSHTVPHDVFTGLGERIAIEHERMAS